MELVEKYRNHVMTSTIQALLLDPSAVMGCPKLQILQSVVVPYAVDVVDLLGREELAPEVLLHDESVLPLPGRRVAGLVPVDIAGLLFQ